VHQSLDIPGFYADAPALKGCVLMLSRMKLGLGLLFSGLALPAIVYVGADIYCTNDASYGGPPNQGAMILAYFALVISVALGGCLSLAGLILAALSLRKSTPRPTPRAEHGRSE
jgi:hypothetical protein